MNSPVKTIAIVVVVVVALGFAAWSIRNSLKGPQGHVNMTGAEIMEYSRTHGGR